MKLLHYVEGRCNPDTANGVDKTIYYVCREQARLGHEVHLASTTDKEMIVVEGVRLHRIHPLRNPLACSPEVRSLFDEVKPDVVHLHSAYVAGNIVFAREARRRKVPYVVTPNGNCSPSLMRRRPWLKFPYKMLIERPMMNAAAFIHSVGDTAQIRNYGVRVPVVEGLNGIDLSLIPAESDADFVARRYPAWADRRVLLFLGRLDIEQKGLDLLLEAFGGVSHKVSDAALLLVGPEWQGSVRRLEARIEVLGLRGAVALHGPAYGGEKFDLMKSSTAFVHASRWEGLPFAVVEAMAMSCACVVTRAADPAGLLEKHGAGIVCDSGVADLTDALERMLSLDSEGRAALGRAAREVVEREMRWEQSARKISEAFERYCGGSLTNR